MTDRQVAFLARVIAALENEGVEAPDPQELARRLVVPPQAVAEILRLGEKAGAVVEIAGRYYSPGQLEALAARLREGAGGRPFDSPRAREILGTTRRYATPLLEYFDEAGVTLREGGLRTFPDAG